MKSKPRIFLLSFWIVFWLCSAPMTAVQARSLKNSIDFYRSQYGEIFPEHNEQVRRVHAVFARVRAVADKNSTRLPRLAVVNSPDNPWAISLPDGYIVLSIKAVEICFRLASAEETDARLAFVLGHELAHLAHDDFLHNEIHSFISRQHPPTAMHPFLQQINAGVRELAADNTGFIYAAIAGFQVGTLLGDGQSKGDFFNYWAKQTSQQTAPQKKTDNLNRAAALKAQLSKIHEKIILFEYGVRLSHFGACDDAVHFFEDFLQVYPGREVFNNLGYCHLQMALKELPPERAYYFWLPHILDGKTQAQRLFLRSTLGAEQLTAQLDTRVGEQLRSATEYFSQAVTADPGYLPARINLASTYIYQGKPFQARAIVEETLRIAPEHKDALILKALSVYLQDGVGEQANPAAMKILQNLADAARPDPKTLYNLARIATEKQLAQTSWNRLAGEAHQLPGVYRSAVCASQNLKAQTDCDQPEQQAAAPAPWQWPVSELTSGLLTDSVSKSLQNWRSQPVRLEQPVLQGHVYSSPDHLSELLELEDFVQMKVLKQPDLGTRTEAQRHCSVNLQRRDLAHGTVWTCGNWAVLTRNDTVREAWWMAN